MCEHHKQISTTCFTDLLLKCFVLGDDEERVFPVEISRDGILKDDQEEKGPNHTCSSRSTATRAQAVPIPTNQTKLAN